MHRRSVRSSTDSLLSVLEWEGGDPTRQALLVHGLSSNAATWTGVGESLSAAGARVIAVDQRSHGRSEVTENGYDFDTYTADLLAVVIATGLGKPLVVGQSWGGNVVFEFALRHPERCRGAVGIDGGAIRLADRYPTWDRAAAELAPPRFSGVTAEQLRTRLRQMRPDWPDSGIEGALANFRVLEDGTVTPNLPFDKHMRILESLYHHDPRHAAEHATVPMLLVAATEPDGIDWPTEVIVVEGDHDLHAQQPKRIADLMLDWAGWA